MKWLTTLLWVTCLSVPCPLLAQQSAPSTESLVQIWKKVLQENPDSVLTLTALYLTEEFPDSSYSKIMARYYQGKAYYANYQLQESSRAFQWAIQGTIQSERDSLLAIVRIDLADVYSDLGLYNIGIPHLLKALDYYEVLEDSSRIIRTKMALGRNYVGHDDNAQAEKTLFECLGYYQRQGDSDRVGGCFTNLSALYSRMGDHEKELNYLNQALTYWELLNNKPAYVGAKNNLAIYYESQERYDLAIPILRECLPLWEELQQPFWKVLTLANLGNNLYHNGQLEEAEKVLAQAQDESEALEADIITLQIYEYRAYLYEDLGKAQLALESYKKYTALKEDVLADENEESLQIAEVRYGVEKLVDQVKIEQLNLKNEKAETMALRTQRIYAVFLIVMLIGILALAYSRYRYKLKASALLHEASVEKLNLQKELLRHENREKNKQISAFTLKTIEQNSVYNQAIEQIESLKDQSISEEQQEMLERVIQKLKRNQSTQLNWEEFHYYFEKVHPDFFKILQEKFPKLTLRELRLCAFIRQGLTIQEIADLLNVSYKAVETSRYRMRKKMNLETSENLLEIISSIS
ncbi:tetratricopeptide repeat protein [bacterium SCSIO 12741]|nr:tetratricopeptide repeat protein [bacterium SCSIO 12741]